MLCADHIEYGADGRFIPCPNCNANLVRLVKGPAYSSLVEDASRKQFYRGAIKKPSAIGRPVLRGWDRKKENTNNTPASEQRKTGADHIQFACCECGKTISAPAKYAGTSGKCKRCGAMNVVPAFSRRNAYAGLDQQTRKIALAIKSWFAERGTLWWKKTGNCNAVCDRCSQNGIEPNRGFLIGGQLQCETCVDELLTSNVKWDKAKADLDAYFGESLPSHITSMVMSRVAKGKIPSVERDPSCMKIQEVVVFISDLTGANGLDKRGGARVVVNPPRALFLQADNAHGFGGRLVEYIESHSCRQEICDPKSESQWKALLDEMFPGRRCPCYKGNTASGLEYNLVVVPEVGRQKPTSSGTPSANDPILEKLQFLSDIAEKKSTRQLQASKGESFSLKEIAKREAKTNVPCLLASPSGKPICILTIPASDATPQTAPAVNRGKVSLAFTFHSFQNYPVLRVLATITDDPADPYKLEALPFFGIGDVPDFFACVLSAGEVSVHLFTTPGHSEIASTVIRFSTPELHRIRDHVQNTVTQYVPKMPVLVERHTKVVNAFMRANPL